jgi:hypothetical protein
MSNKFFKVIYAIVLSIGLVGQANASVIYFEEGTNYSDFDGNFWEYIGFFDLSNLSQLAPDDQKPLTGLEAALALFPAAGDTVADFAISAFLIDSIIDNPTFNPSGGVGAITAAEILLEMQNSGNDYADVTHSAWYDTYLGSLSIKSEDTPADVDGDSIYSNGDSSALVNDRSGAGLLNYVFVKAIDVPEPSTLAIFALALCALGARKFKR